jgi:Raf kinase inhibitor-like YbhB/YbcL family protein
VSFAACSVLLAAVDLAGGGAPAQDAARRAEEATMEMRSSAFDAGGKVPPRYTCDGEDVSPPLGWDGIPEGAQSLALIMDDPDAPPGTWVHWVLYDLPPDTPGLNEGVKKTERLENGALQGACWGVTSFSRVGYYGPCPPPGGPHRYVFRLYALDRRLGLPPRATKVQVLEAMEGHVLAQAELVGRYAR